MQKHWKKIVAVVIALAVLVVAGSFIYAKFINKAPDKLSSSDVIDALDATVPATTAAATTATTAAATATTTATTAADSGSGVDGDWTITQASTLRYRVKESINGFDTEAVGETHTVTGSLTLAGTKATAAKFTVDMTNFISDESRRDSQFNGRVMSVDQFPTSTFVLTSPIDFGAVPADGTEITTTATGDLTLRGVTNSVTFELSATQKNGKIGVLGNIPVVFADYSITNPSFGTIETEDHGLLEFVLVFEKS